MTKQLSWNGPRQGAPRGLVITLRQRDSVLVAVQHERMIQGGEFEIPLGLLPALQVPRAGMALGLWREPRAR